MQFQKAFSQRLKQKRKEKGFSQKELAELLRYSEKTVSKWESGKSMPTLEVFSQICDIMGLDSREMLAINTDVYYLGVDGGGTKTSYLLCDSNNKVVASHISEGCNPYDIGIEKAKSVLKTGITAVCGQIPSSSIRAHVGIAGGRFEEHRIAVSKLLQEMGFAAYSVGNDNDNLIAVGLGDDDGITVIMGTGFCLYQVMGGKKTQIGGFGYLFDEGGSAFNLGQDALSAMYDAFDGTGQATILTELIRKQTGLEERELLPRLYEGGKRYIASFASLVFQAERAGDQVAKAIVRRNMKAVARRLEFAGKDFGGEKVKVVVAGGLIREEKLLTYLLKELAHPERFDVSILQDEIVCGAVYLARKL